MTTKILTSVLLTTIVTTSLQAKEIKNPEMIFAKKCEICHHLTKPHNKEMKKKMAAPPIRIVMKNLMIGIDAIEEPVNKKELDSMTIAFIEDYLFAPSREKSYCEDISFKKFGMMPSMTGFLTKNQAAIVAPWVVENFAPIKDAKGEYRISK